MIRLVPLSGNAGTRSSSLSAVSIQQEDVPLKSRERALFRNQIGWHIDLGLPSLQNHEKKMFVV